MKMKVIYDWGKGRELEPIDYDQVDLYKLSETNPELEEKLSDEAIKQATEELKKHFEGIID